MLRRKGVMKVDFYFQDDDDGGDNDGDDGGDNDNDDGGDSDNDNDDPP